MANDYRFFARGIKGTDQFVIFRYDPGFGGNSNLSSTPRMTEDQLRTEFASTGLTEPEIDAKVKEARENAI